MRTGTKLFLATGAFAAILTTVYWFISYEDAGTILLASWAAMSLTLAAYGVARGVLRRGDLPEDREDATPADVAGSTVGSFPFSSVWPVVFTGGSILLAAGLIYGVLLLPVGVAVCVVAVLGLMRDSRS